MKRYFFVLLIVLSHFVQAQNQVLEAVDSESLGIKGAILNREIDKIMEQAIDSTAFPGGQILLAKDGKVFFHRAYGYHTYSKAREVQLTDIYDLASVTKTTAATLALMKLYDDGLFDPDQTMGFYFPKVAKGKKKDLVMRDVLAHQAGLRAWIPYWSESQNKKGKFKSKTVSSDSSANYPFRLSESDLFMHKDFIEKKIYKMIKKSKVSDDKSYLYSGLTFYLIPELVERLTDKTFDQYLQEQFYGPLGSKTMGFNPTDRFVLDEIVPTEVDSFFRMQTLHGVVHDEGAAMMKGVSGNAGLFSNAMDLAKVYQMLLNDGVYDGKQYLKPSTIEEFTRCQFCESGNRRGLGWDKPLVDYRFNASSVARGASPESYGHTGYTGTLVWADPKNDLLFVFLSNRVHPTRDSRKIYELNVRPRIHNLVYDLFRIGQEGTYTIGQHWD